MDECSAVGRNSINFLFLSPGGIVDEGILKQGAEHKEDANPGPDIDGLGVGHGWEGVLNAGLGGGHGQQGGHS